MSWRTSAITIALRNFGRSVGLNKILTALISSGKYEDLFQRTMLSEVRSGDCVWDVGANVGLYSSQLSERVGPGGKVYAFEPSPVNFPRLKAAVGSCSNVTLLPVALGDHEGSAVFEQGVDSVGATSRVVTEKTARAGEYIDVELCSGDYLVAFKSVAAPNVIKIDTEGFEFDVLRGLSKTLQCRSLRVLCIEIHFGLLKKRGLLKAPAEIEMLLHESGFHCYWPDSSHVVARRVV